MARRKLKQTNIDKFGVDNFSKTKEFKEKFKEACLKRFGVDNFSKTKEFKEKFNKTCLQKYGVDFVFKSDEFKEKSRQTCMEKYGVDNYIISDEFKEKNKKTCQERYGVDNPMGADEIKEKRLDISKKKFIERLNENYELIKFDKILRLKHKVCGCEFEIDRSLYFTRLYKFSTEICTSCNPLLKFWSSAEKDLLDFIKSTYDGKIIANTHKTIFPYELDIYLPDLHLAFEFNGLYWHSELKIPDNYHRNKTIKCKKLNIHLIHVYEDDWIYRQEIIKSIILGHLGKHQKIGARECEIKEIGIKEFKDFCNKNHLQGFVGSTVYCGLYFNGELIQIMSFKRTGVNVWENTRLCSKLNTSISGGASKLLNSFIKKYNPEKIVTFNNDGLYRGSIYEKIGFKFVNCVRPNYSYVVGDNRINKRKFRKSKINTNSTEHDYMLHTMKYPRIYDSGLSKYEMVLAEGNS